MSDKIRSVLGPKFGDEWERIFGQSPTEELDLAPCALCGHPKDQHGDRGCRGIAGTGSCFCGEFVEETFPTGNYEGWR